jgi:hypothetical protein
MFVGPELMRAPDARSRLTRRVRLRWLGVVRARLSRAILVTVAATIRVAGALSAAVTAVDEILHDPTAVHAPLP